MRFQPHVEKFKEEVIAAHKDKNPLMFHGVYGDMENCIGIVQPPVIKPPEGGTLVRLYGCSYLFKGYLEDFVTDGGSLSLGKAMISKIPRETIARSIPLMLTLAFMYVFQRKKLYVMMQSYFLPIDWYAVAKNKISESKMNVPSREILRTFQRVVANEQSRGKTTHLWLDPLSMFIASFLEYDVAYRFRVQDILGEVNKENVKKSVVKETIRLANLMLQRENGIAFKLAAVRRMLRLALWLCGDMRRIVRTFLTEIDIEKVKLDESDWYFCLRRAGYNFKGISLNDRLALAKQIDKDKGHLIVKGYYQTVTTPHLAVEVPDKFILPDDPMPTAPQGIELGERPLDTIK